MEIFCETEKLTRILGDGRKLVREYGVSRANKIIQRLSEFKASVNLAQISYLPPQRLHKLKANRKEEFAVTIESNWRITFQGYDSDDLLSIDKGKIVTLSIMAIEDYH